MAKVEVIYCKECAYNKPDLITKCPWGTKIIPKTDTDFCSKGHKEEGVKGKWKYLGEFGDFGNYHGKFYKFFHLANLLVFY